MIGTLLGITPPAFAHEIDATDPQKIIDLLKKSEPDVTDVALKKLSSGSPYIQYKQNSTLQVIYFNGCKDGKNCTSLQFTAAWGDTNHTLETVNKWNATKRYTRAYLDNDGDPTLEMDIDLEHKVSSAYLAEAFDTWDTSVFAFKLLSP